MGALPNLLPGGRPLADTEARREIENHWGVEVPASPGRDTAAILEAARTGDLDALLIGGVDPADLLDPAAARAAIDAAGFVVSVELRASAVTERADVVFPVAPVVEKGGAFVNWEGRIRPFEPALQTNATPDRRVLGFLADELGFDQAWVVEHHFRDGRSACPTSEAVLGATLSAVLGPVAAELVRNALAADELDEVNPLSLEAAGMVFDGIVHRTNGLALLELERTDLAVTHGDVRTLGQVLSSLQRATTRDELYAAVARQVRRLTGFERVLLYRFDEDGSGNPRVLDAEQRASQLELARAAVRAYCTP